jgi:FAD/FMN-containing dehydrogenase
VLPRAGGSSLAGQAVNAALVIDTTRHLDQILEINAEEGWVRVQPGVVLDTLNAALRPHGLHFGPDPASSNRACLGGIVSNNASGSHSILYGMTVDHVLEMQVILDDGSPAHFRPLDGEQVRWQMQQSNRGGAIYRQVSGLVYDERNRAAIRRGTPRHWRRCGGYNLARFIHDGSIDHYLPQDERFNLVNLLAGAEGTLAAITELKLKVVPRRSARPW